MNNAVIEALDHQVHNSDYQLLQEELSNESEEAIRYWFSYAIEESRKSNYQPATLKGIQRFKDEAFESFKKAKVSKKKKTITEEKVKATKSKKEERRNKAIKAAKARYLPKQIAELKEEAEQELAILRGTVSKERFEESVNFAIEAKIVKREGIL